MSQPASHHFLEEESDEAQGLPLSETLPHRTPPATQSVQQAVSKEARPTEGQGLADVALYAFYLTMESGASLNHPWIRRLRKVVLGQLDPRKLLKMYVEKPEMLIVRDRRDPSRCWKPPFLGSEPGMAVMVMKISLAMALRALVGKDKSWKTPELCNLIKEWTGMDVA